ncbi:MAG UNVERIFIED_CONTAM: hypothetical protein LVR29_08155 [Microcystis novacekii LVE1205-3]
MKAVLVAIATVSLLLTSDVINPQSAQAYPFWAQQTARKPPESDRSDCSAQTAI